MPIRVFIIRLTLFFLFLYCPFYLLNIYSEDSDVFQAQCGKQGGIIVFSTTSDPKSFNPIVAKETSTTAITGHFFEGLTTTSGITLEVKPNLAESWSVSEDGKVWTFYLRKDVRWFDGEPFTSDDVVFTFRKLIFNPDIPTSARDIFTVEGKTLRVEKVDEHTVKFILPSKFAPFLRAMSQEILPKHALYDVVERGEFNYHWGLDAKPEDIIGTGPFKLAKYLPGERIILIRNPHYWQKDSCGERFPYLEKIIYLIVQNQDVSLLKFQQAELDYYSLRGQDYPILKPEERRGNFTIFNTGPAFGTNFLVFNQNTSLHPKTKKTYISKFKLGWFTQLKFRKAIAHAIDKQSIINIVMNGLGFTQDSSMSPSSGFFYNPEVTKYEYDLAKAKALLKEIGIYDRDKDGFAEDSGGQRIEFNLFTNAGNTVRIQLANIIRKDLENLGFKVNFVPLEFNQLVTKLDSSFDWDAIIIGLTGGIEPHFGNNVWSSRGHLHMWNPRQKRPQSEWEARIDKIFNEAVQELDNQKRKVLYDEWQEIVAQQLPFIYTVLPANIFAVKNKFGNLYPTSYGGAFHNLEEIYIKEK